MLDTCKICGSESEKEFERTLNRIDMRRITENWYRCSVCGFLQTSALDSLSKAEIETMYSYPEYIKYDPFAKNHRRKNRSKEMVKYIERKFGIQNPKILLHGNGQCTSARELLNEGYDVWTTFDRLENWDRSLSVEEAMYGEFDIVCAVEVIEHWSNPLPEIENVKKMLKAGCFFCGTTHVNDGIPKEAIEKNEWSYLGQKPINAGHCSIWSKKSISLIADIFSMENHTDYFASEMPKIAPVPKTTIYFLFKK